MADKSDRIHFIAIVITASINPDMHGYTPMPRRSSRSEDPLQNLLDAANSVCYLPSITKRHPSSNIFLPSPKTILDTSRIPSRFNPYMVLSLGSPHTRIPKPLPNIAGKRIIKLISNPHNPYKIVESRPFVCTMGTCRKAFQRLEHLNRHIKTHTKSVEPRIINKENVPNRNTCLS